MTEESQAGWHARLYRPGDEKGIVALYERVFGHVRSPEWWRWKIKGRPAPLELTWVAVSDEDNSIVGHYPGIPISIKLSGKIRPAIVTLDVMTAPEFRRQGILLRLGEEANRHWRASGYAVVVGLPNEQWGSRTKIIGWQALFSLEWLRFPLHLGRLASRSGKVPKLLQVPAYLAGEAGARLWVRPRVGRLARQAGVSIEEASAAGEKFDRLWASLEGNYANCVVRDSSYVQWRFLNALPVPYKVLLARREGEPVGYIAYRAWAPRGGHNAYIADLFTAPEEREATKALLGGALQDLWRAQAGVVMVTAVPGSCLHRLLREAGGRPSSAAFQYDLIPLDSSLDIKELANPALWLSSGSDTDVV
jgi:predicted N-acetyltransferase YhbS